MIVALTQQQCLSVNVSSTSGYGTLDLASLSCSQEPSRQLVASGRAGPWSCRDTLHQHFNLCTFPSPRLYPSHTNLMLTGTCSSVAPSPPSADPVPTPLAWHAPSAYHVPSTIPQVRLCRPIVAIHPKSKKGKRWSVESMREDIHEGSSPRGELCVLTNYALSLSLSRLNAGRNDDGKGSGLRSS